MSDELRKIVEENGESTRFYADSGQSYKRRQPKKYNSSYAG